MLAYYREVWKTAAADAVAFWTAHKIVTSLPGPLLGILAWAIFKGTPRRSDIMQVIVVCVLLFLASLGLTLLASIVRAPKLLNDQRLSEIQKRDDANSLIRESFAAESSELQQQIERLTPPKRSAAEQHRFDQCKQALDELGQDAITILRHLRLHGRLTINQGGQVQPWPPTPQGWSVRDMSAMLHACKEKNLVTDIAEMKPTGGVMTYEQRTFWIAPGMESALEELLYSADPV